MTAEIAILNKSSVALAADSAVTISQGGKQKTYDVNKLFTLSKLHPVGIMIYGNATVMRVPWEILIKEFRIHLGETSCDRIEGYAESFIEFVQSHQLFTKSQQSKWVRIVTHVLYQEIKSSIDKKIKLATVKNPISEKEIRAISKDEISTYKKTLAASPKLPKVSVSVATYLKKQFVKQIELSIAEHFKNEQLTVAAKRMLIEIAGLTFVRNHEFPVSQSGVVIAGFGDKDSYPAIIELSVSSVINKKLVYKVQQSISVTDDCDAIVAPFAQKDVVLTLVEGVDPYYQQLVKTLMESLFTQYPDVILDTLKAELPVVSAASRKKIKTQSEQIAKNCLDSLTKIIKDRHVDPLLDVVKILPKENLASMAEALINLTSLKRQMSLDLETVGGPIDVAVISKGDGFIWLKRKHYFKPELNRTWFEKYYL